MINYPNSGDAVIKKRSASTFIDQDRPSRKVKPRSSFDSRECGLKNEEEFDSKRFAYGNEVFRISQAVLLLAYVLTLSYHGIRHGQIEYSLLENGRIVEGYVHKAVVTLSLGYSFVYSILSIVAAVMLLYSLLSRNASWSLPSIVLCLADLVCDVGDAMVAIWLFFSRFPVSNALFYAVGTILIISLEIWVWLGVLRLYEQRTFSN